MKDDGTREKGTKENIMKENGTREKGTKGTGNNMEKKLERTFRFLKKKFMDYYSIGKVPSPQRLAKREWAFTFFGKDFMLRHQEIRANRQLSFFLKQKAPSAVYFSTAYYNHPAASSMNDKDWLGADLIFDLDADHISGAGGMSYEEMLGKVKEEFNKLIYDFLLRDFGFKARDIQVVFSGGRGYHIHIHRPDVLGLKSPERREIVDYITGRGLEVEDFVEKRAIDMKNRGSRFSKVNYSYRLPSQEEPGWRGRITRGVVEVAQSFRDRESAIERITSLKGVGKKTAESIISELFDNPTGKMKFDSLETGNVDVFSADRNLKAFLKLALQEAAINLGGETDEPVTSDIKRLIRMPGSLHGKTGFRVVPMSLEELEEFDPLVDAVVLPGESVVVNVTKDISGRVRDEIFSFKKGEKVDVPVYLAVFLMGRKSALIA